MSLICNGTNQTHHKAISDGVSKKFRLPAVVIRIFHAVANRGRRCISDFAFLEGVPQKMRRVNLNSGVDEKRRLQAASYSRKYLVIREGLEPSTQWLKAICSTD